MRSNTPKYDRAYWQRKHRELIQKLGGKCKVCGSKIGLEIHHLKQLCARSRPNKEALTETKNKILLCRRDHIKWHVKHGSTCPNYWRER